jgi:hypothetical protein
MRKDAGLRAGYLRTPSLLAQEGVLHLFLCFCIIDSVICLLHSVNHSLLAGHYLL